LKYLFSPNFEKRDSSDVLIVPFWEGMFEASSMPFLQAALASGDFKGKMCETLFVYGPALKEKRVLLLGLGKQEVATIDSLRKAYAAAIRSLQQVKAKTANLIFPKESNLSREEMVTGIWEGLLLANYAFNEWKGDSLKDAPPLIERVVWIGLDSNISALLDHLKLIIEGVCFARDLVNGNADDITPRKLADTAIEIGNISSKIKTTIHDKKWLEKEKMGLILAVNRGSSVDPFLIEVSYQGNTHSKEHIVLVGKGVTYDTGGLSLKPTDGMLVMKCDMAGAAVVLATLRTIALLDLKVNVTVVVPTVENAIDSRSYKLGDVYRSYCGKTVEINNTDAEGRLILADALSYVTEHLKPTYVIDLATLTGNVVMALGEQMAGFCANDDALAAALMNASAKTSDLLWRLPLIQEYKEAFKSDIADLTNSGGRDAGSIKGALFLQEFIRSAKWAHLDIAGTAYLSKPKHYHTTKATGYGVRLLVEFLKHC
jgi:leucyl aminopeptidase